VSHPGPPMCFAPALLPPPDSLCHPAPILRALQHPIPIQQATLLHFRHPGDVAAVRRSVISYTGWWMSLARSGLMPKGTRSALHSLRPARTSSSSLYSDRDRRRVSGALEAARPPRSRGSSLPDLRKERRFGFQRPRVVLPSRYSYTQSTLAEAPNNQAHAIRPKAGSS
jgi:hypothetical protein